MVQARLKRPDSQVQSVYDALYALALAEGPEAKLPTIRELIARLSSSYSTVNEALNLLEDRNVIYRKHGSGIFVSPKLYCKNIYILLSSEMFLVEPLSPFWGRLWSLFAREAQQRSSTRNEVCTFFMTVPLDEKDLGLPQDVINNIERGKVHGVLGIGLQPQTWQWILKQRIPLVTTASYGEYTVGWDEPQRVQLSISHLVAQGCRKLALWVAAFSSPGQKYVHWDTERIDAQAFLSLLPAYGLTLYPHFMRAWQPQYPDQLTPSPQQQGYELAMEVFGDATSPKPDGLIVLNDMVTLGVLTALRKLGLQAGKDVKIATHSNTGTSTLFGYTDDMIVLESDPADIVREMFTMLDTLLEGNEPPEHHVGIKHKVL